MTYDTVYADEEVQMGKRTTRRRKETWSAADVKCPFFIRDNQQEIECEGFGEGMTVVLSYSNLGIKDKHMGTYCAGRFDGCPIYKDTYQKYAD